MYKIPASTLFLGKNLVFVPECHSTNTLALQLCQQPSTPEGTLVITNNQTAGRGQMGNSWEAQPGQNLTFSLVLKPSFLTVNEQYYLNMAISLGILDYLRSKLQHLAFVKWPNDLLVMEKKVCGILIENSVQGASISHAVAGIGLNVNQTTFGSPRASSLSIFTGDVLELPIVLESLLNFLEARYLSLRQGRKTGLKEDYHQAMLGFEVQRTFTAQGKEFRGTITGVDDIGRLKITTRDGERVFGLKEVEFVY